MSSIVDIDELGRRIRNLRLERRMTLKQVENASALSATHLSEIERGRTSPTIGALVRIARALGRETSYFIEHDERPDVAHRTREQLKPETPARGVIAESLTPGVPGSGVFPYRIVMEQGSELRLEAQDLAGEAMYLVRSGSLETQIGPSHERLEIGDATQASLSLSHRIAPAPGGSAELIAVLTKPLHELAGA